MSLNGHKGCSNIRLLIAVKIHQTFGIDYHPVLEAQPFPLGPHSPVSPPTLTRSLIYSLFISCLKEEPSVCPNLPCDSAVSEPEARQALVWSCRLWQGWQEREAADCHLMTLGVERLRPWEGCFHDEPKEGPGGVMSVLWVNQQGKFHRALQRWPPATPFSVSSPPHMEARGPSVSSELGLLIVKYYWMWCSECTDPRPVEWVFI